MTSPEAGVLKIPEVLTARRTVRFYKADPVPADQEDVAEQAIAECPRAALIRRD